MNTIGSGDSPVAREAWEKQEMRDVLAKRDISSVYRLLCRQGISQRQIAALAGQSQSEVSEILKGRQVMAYDVLARIAEGLAIPRGYMGLAFDGSTACLSGPGAETEPEEEESVKRRKFLAHAAAVTMGAAVFGGDKGTWVPSVAQTPTPNRIGMTDVRQIQAATTALRSLDYQYGGGFCRDAVVAQLSWARQLVNARPGSEDVRNRLLTALADLHNLAGWTSFDTGLLDSARDHFGQALGYAKEAKNDALVANILYRMGRVYLQGEAPNDALKLFQLGQLAAQDSGSPLTVAVLCANEAWAYAMMERPDQALTMLSRTKDEFARAGSREDTPDWVRFFDTTDLYRMIGSVHHSLAASEEHRVKHAPLAVTALVRGSSVENSEFARSNAFTLSMLATGHIRNGDLHEGLRVGEHALRAAQEVRSYRVLQRIKPLELEAGRYRNNVEARDLSERIHQLRAG
jgi:transcriptional regulator with XRE-family HTH domain/tetratricopeptide (TPR) repeat protein